MRIKKFGETLSGKEQLAVSAFATSLEIIPKTLAENSGLDSIDILTALKSEHEKGKKNAGIDVFSGKVVDAKQMNVIEPLKMKTQIISSATEVATLILRIDDVIIGNKGKGGGMPQMPPGGMPEY